MALMTRQERDLVFTMASLGDIKTAIVDQHAEFLYWIVGRIKSDNFNILKMASFLKDKWEDVAIRMNYNRGLSHQEYAELMADIISMMEIEFRALGYNRNEFLSVCSELQ